MSGASEPFVVRAGTGRTRLADVLIVNWDGRPPYTQLAALFAEYPGLTLVLVLVTRRTVVTGTRDGAVSVLHLAPTTPVRVAAAALYHGWVASSARMIRARGELSSS